VSRIVVIAAMAKNRVIGRQGGMPWHLPADLRHFKALTVGHPVIMGRKTFESIGQPLPNRLNVVVSRTSPSLPRGVETAENLVAAFAMVNSSPRVMVIGGGQIYEEALPLADDLELTLIDAEIDGDTHFPALDVSEWLITAQRSRPADDRNAHALRFLSLTRRTGLSAP
jgi:dihydrofolate reductase